MATMTTPAANRNRRSLAPALYGALSIPSAWSLTRRNVTSYIELNSL